MGSDSRYYPANISLISYLLLTLNLKARMQISFRANEYFLDSQQLKNYQVMHFLVDLCLYRHPGLGYLAGPPHPYSRVHQMSQRGQIDTNVVCTLPPLLFSDDLTSVTSTAGSDFCVCVQMDFLPRTKSYKMYNKFSFYSIVVQTVAPEGSS